MEEPVRSQARLDQTKRLSNAILRRTVVMVLITSTLTYSVPRSC